MKIVFLQSSSTSYSFLDYNESEVDSSIPSNCSLYLFGRALITRNVELINSLYDLETVFVPKKLNFISSIIKSTTDIPVEEIDENTYGKLIKSELRFLINSRSPRKTIMETPTIIFNKIHSLQTTTCCFSLVIPS